MSTGKKGTHTLSRLLFDRRCIRHRRTAYTDTPFCSSDLDLDPMTLIYDLALTILKMSSLDIQDYLWSCGYALWQFFWAEVHHNNLGVVLTSCLNANVPVPSGPHSLLNGSLIFAIVSLVTLLIFFSLTAVKRTLKCVDFSDFLNFTRPFLVLVLRVLHLVILMFFLYF